MPSTQTDGLALPLIFAPKQGKPAQLFVLLHGSCANPRQLDSLTQALKQAFPQALLVLPYGCVGSDNSSRSWLDSLGLNETNYADRVVCALPALTAYIQAIQEKYGLTGEYTALAGFDQGATIALEACSAQPTLAGRVLAFSGGYAALPAIAPPATTLHLLHGADDSIIPVSVMQNLHGHLADLQADATLDIASGVGHELHGVLIQQAIYRLQTCVPLRSWKTALSELNSQPDAAPDGTQNRTLH